MKSSAACLALLLVTSLSPAAVTTSPLFGHHSVLLRSADTPIFGQASPGEKVTVTLADQTATTVTPDSGEWLLRLNLARAPQGPHQLKVNDRVFTDILIGEVWLCSGQSNMGFRLSASDRAQAEAQASTNDLLRSFTVPAIPHSQPVRKLQGQWVAASPKTSPHFTAVGYYFAKRLQRELKVPVGIIHASVGAASIQAWFAREDVSKDPKLTGIFQPDDRFYHHYRSCRQQWVQQQRTWMERFKRQDRDTSSSLPKDGWISKPDLNRYVAPGAVWLRRTITLKPNALNQPFTFFYDHFNSREWRLSHSSLRLFWNGTEIQPTFKDDIASLPRVFFTIPANLTKQAANTLVVRQFNPVRKDSLFATIWSNYTGNLGLDGWDMKVDFALPPLTAAERKAMPPLGQAYMFMKYPCALYNAMINPLLPVGLSGVIWYQGEGNASKPTDYAYLFPQLIKTWRQRFQKPNLPFYWCQLANYMSKSSNPGDEITWANLRDAQTQTLNVPHTGQAVLIDAGESQDIHPRDKQTPGDRLAAIALAQIYGKDIPYQGPAFLKAVPKGGTIRVTFKHAEGGLVARPLPDTYPQRTSQNRYAKLVRNTPDSQLEGFAIAGKDGKWHWAQARIDGSAVILSSPQVPAPLHVRYAWQNNPTVNLYNKAGLPAVPFSTSPDGDGKR